MASRSQSYKKTSTMDKRDKRLMRVHRRSLDQREMRHDEVNKRRQIDDMSPVLESKEGSKNPSHVGTPVNQRAAMSRLERLKKWKEEKELKKKLEAMERARSKPGFKVVHLNYNDRELFKAGSKQKTAQNLNKVEKAPSTKAQVPSARQAPSKVPPASKARTTRSKVEPVQPAKRPAASSTVTRTTRSQAAAKASVEKPSTTSKRPSPRKPGRSHFMEPTAASRTRATNAKKGPAHSQQPTKKKTADQQMKVKDTANISTHRGDLAAPAEPSFAPSGFEFEAPSNLPSFVFKPLSPASVAGFLYPQSGANSTTLSSFTDNVGRTSTPKREGQGASGSQQKQTPENGLSSVGSTDASPLKAQNDSVANSVPQDYTAAAASQPVKSPLGMKSASDNPDSGIEVETEMKNEEAKLPASSADSATSGEEGDVFVNDGEQNGTKAVSTPMENRRRSTRQWTAAKEQVAETAASDNNPSGKEAEPMTPQSVGKGRRKSKRISTMQSTQEEPESSEVESPMKRRRSSRRSTVSVSATQEVVDEPMEAVIEEVEVAQLSKPEHETMEIKTPGRSRRSRRSVASSLDPVSEKSSEVIEAVSEMNEEKGSINANKPSRKERRKSRRSQLPSSDFVEEPQPMETESTETANEKPEDKDNTKDLSAAARNRRRSRRSVVRQTLETDVASVEQTDGNAAASVEQICGGVAATGTSSEEELITCTKRVTLVDVIQTEELLPTVATPEPKKGTLRSGQTRDDLFLTPGPPPSSRKHSAKRRRTAAMIALSKATSPEEAIKILSTSPMVEMNRRTPKSKTSPELRLNTTAALFDDDDVGVEPTKLLSAFEASTIERDGGTKSCDDSASAEKPADTQEATESAERNNPSEETRDVTPFRERLAAEIKKLTELADHWTEVKKSTSGIPDEVAGQVDTTVCQAQLLMGRKGKFHQFAGLVDKCQAGDPSTTCQDLQGFQDMIFIQAEDIYSKFSQLERLQQNNWQPEVSEETAPNQLAKKIVKKAGLKKKPAVKSKFAAFKAQLLEQRKAKETEVEGQPEEKVFDAGFFKVSSPVKSPQYHCEAGTPQKKKTCRQSPEFRTTPSTSSAENDANLNNNNNNNATESGTVNADNKENVAHTLLRRSMGATPRRKSYIPVVPSPLLQDGVPRQLSPSPKKSSPKVAEETTEALACAEKSEETPKRSRRSTSRRLSTRSRKSVCFAEEPETVTMETERSQGEVDLSAYFQPSSQSSSPLKENVLENSPFSCEDILRLSQTNTPASVSLSADSQQQATGGRPKSALKSLPTKERRKSRRSVIFALSPEKESASGGVSMPSTPYNRNSLVAGKRVSRRSLASPSTSEQSAVEELQELSNTPRMMRSARPSLLYTPPKLDEDKPKTPAKDVPVATLVSFTP